MYIECAEPIIQSWSDEMILLCSGVQNPPYPYPNTGRFKMYCSYSSVQRGTRPVSVLSAASARPMLRAPLTSISCEETNSDTETTVPSKHKYGISLLLRTVTKP